MNLPYFIASRISVKARRSFSKLIVRIAIGGVMMSLAVMLLSVAIIKGFKLEIKEKVRGYLGDVRIYKYDLNNSFESTPFVAGDSTFNALRGNPQVAYYQNFATKPAIISVNGEVEGINFKGVEAGFNWDFIRKNIKEGGVIDFSDSTRSMQQILISRTTANRLKLKIGDSFILYFVQDPPRPRKMTVTGIYEIGIDVIDKGFAIGSMEVIRRVNGWKDNQIGGIEVRVKDFKNLKQTADKIYDDLGVSLQAESVEQYYPGIFVWLGLLDVNTRVLLVLMLVVGVINMVTALLIMILERVNMVGMLKALGATNLSIMKIFLYNSVYLVSLGLLFGNILGLGLIWLQHSTHLFKLAETSYYLSYVPVDINLSDVLILNLLTVAVCFFVLILPSMLVIKISPLKAIRFK